MEQLFGAIPTVIGGLESHDKVNEAVAFAAWSRCAGEMLSDRTVPIKFAKKRLLIAVSDKTWQRHLEDLSPQMIAKINTSLGQGSVRFIEFQIDEEIVNKTHADIVSEVNGGVNAVAPELAKAALAIADEDLREHFLNTAGSYLNRQKVS